MEAGLNASLELQCRKSMEIRTKHVRAGFAAGLEGLKAMEIGAKQYDKEGALFWTSKRKKKQARKNEPPQHIGLTLRSLLVSWTLNTEKVYSLQVMRAQLETSGLSVIDQQPGLL